LDQKFANSYLVGFSKKVAEGIIADKSLIQDIVSQKVLTSFEIERNDGTVKKLKIFMSPSFNKEDIPDKEGIFKYFNGKVHRYFAEAENGDVYQIQYGVFKDLLIPYDRFFNK